jgi:hypothetical protein
LTFFYFVGGSQFLQQILWNKFQIRCAYFTPNCTWSPNYSVLVLSATAFPAAEILCSYLSPLSALRIFANGFSSHSTIFCPAAAPNRSNIRAYAASGGWLARMRFFGSFSAAAAAAAAAAEKKEGV